MSYVGPVLSLDCRALTNQTEKSSIKCHQGCFPLWVSTLRTCLEDGQSDVSVGQPLPITCHVHAKVIGNIDKADLEQKRDEK